MTFQKYFDILVSEIAGYELKMSNCVDMCMRLNDRFAVPFTKTR